MAQSPIDHSVRAKPKILFLVLACIGGFALLMWLGKWQLDRQAWKDQLILNMETTPQASRVDVQQIDPERIDDHAFQYVDVKGHWGIGPNYFVIGRTHQKRPGYHFFNIVELPNGKLLVVNIGWVAHKNYVQKPRASANFIGRLRKGEEPGWLAPPHKPGIQEWSSIDLKAMGNAIGKEVLPFYVDYMRPDHGRPPFPIAPQIPINNNHFGYAVTWFSLGALWLLMFMLLIYRVRRETL